MLIKRIASVCFAIAFLMALVVFGQIGTRYISTSTARLIFMIAGAAALVLNLFSFQAQSGKHNPSFNLAFWLGSVVVFVGLIFKFMYWPYYSVIMIAGLAITGISFFLSPSLLTGKSDNTDVLDDPKNQL